MTADIHPIQFGGHSGYFHVPRHGPYRKTGVVLCSGPGRDGRCGYRFLFELAQTLAAQGVIVLRYEPLGCGNSADLSDPEGDCITAWMAGMREAVAKLRQIPQVETVILGGLRFSATLAALSEDACDGLMLFGPVTKGRTWIRELKIARAVLAPTKEDRPQTDGLDADGLYLSAASLRRLSDLSLSKDIESPAFIAAHNPESEALGADIRKGARHITLEPFDGFVELFEDTSRNQIPWALIDKATAWLIRTYPSAPLEAIDFNLATAEAAIEALGVTDTAVCFGPGLRGNYCAPTQTPQTDLSVIICNTSGEPRAGIGAYSTTLSRNLAGVGIASLRFDFAGVGDSDRQIGMGRHIYETPRHDDFRAAAAFLQTKGAKRLVLMGVCSGGYHSLRHGIELDQVEAVVAINTLKFVWDGEPKARDLGRSSQAYWALAKKPGTWLRLFSNRVDVQAISKTLYQRLTERLASTHRRKIRKYRSDVAQFLNGGGQVFALLGTEDASLDALETVFGPRGQHLLKTGGRVTIDQYLDHGLALKTSRDRALDHVMEYVKQL